MTSVKTVVLILLFAVPTFLTFGQDAEELAQEPSVQVSGAEEQEEEPSGDDVSDTAPDRFIPTEQVSQDVGISFPSDI